MVGVKVELGDIGGERGESIGGSTKLRAKREQGKVAWAIRCCLVPIHLVSPIESL